MTEWEEYADYFRKEVAEKIEQSSVFISLCPIGEKGPDLKFSLELGYAIMLDKPIIAIAQTGTPMPEHLRRVADEIIEGDIRTPEGGKQIAEALARLVKKHG